MCTYNERKALLFIETKKAKLLNKYGNLDLLIKQGKRKDLREFYFWHFLSFCTKTETDLNEGFDCFRPKSIRYKCFPEKHMYDYKLTQ